MDDLTLPAEPAPDANRPEILLSTSRFEVVRQGHKLPDGSIRQREFVRHPGAVVIVPILDDGRVCLIRNYRLAVQEWLWELPAGTIDPGESPAATAARELIEETGYMAAVIEPVCGFWMSPGILNERMHLFLATGLIPGSQALAPGEQIETFETPWPEALAMVDDGRIQDAKSMAALLLLDRRRRIER